MFEENEQSASIYRKKAGELIKCVLAKKILTRQALLMFPKDVKDESVRASWHALCHLEADEDIRARDSEYALVQNSFLNDMANTLLEGIELPSDIRNAYKEYHDDMPLTPHIKGVLGLIASFEKFLNIKK